MHFTTYVIYPNMEISKDTKDYLYTAIEENFTSNYCYCCGETMPMVESWCDWFQIGGRWVDAFKAKKGIKGQASLLDKEYKGKKGYYDIVNIKDIVNLKKVNKPYAIIINGHEVVRCKDYDENWEAHDNPEFDKLFNDFRNGKFTGVVAQIDCHD